LGAVDDGGDQINEGSGIIFNLVS